MKCTIPFMFSLSCAMVCNLAIAEKLYKWIDDNGVTHYTQHKPVNLTSEVIKPKTGHSDPVAPAAIPAAPAADPKIAAAADAKAALKDPERCSQARKNQETLKTFARIKVKGDNGEYRYLTPDEQKQKTTEANKAIEESCN